MENISKPSLISNPSMYGGGAVILISVICWFVVLAAFPVHHRSNFFLTNFLPMLGCILTIWLANYLDTEKGNHILPLSLIVISTIVSIGASIYATIRAKKESDKSKKIEKFNPKVF